MALNMIGIGLSDERDITLKGLELIKRSDILYLENYTSILQTDRQKLEELYGKEVLLVGREFVEDGKEIIEKAKEKDVSLLIIGDPFSATTHYELYQRAKAEDIPVKVISNASILTAVGITGLQLYKFGKVTSIPFAENYTNISTPYEVLKSNLSLGLHTLFLLDLNPSEERFMTVNNAVGVMLKLEENQKNGIFTKETLCIGCARLGSDDYKIAYGRAEDLMQTDFGIEPHCLIVPGKLHFMEEEALEGWRYSI